MNNIPSFSELPIEEQIDIFINRVSGDEHEEEIHHILAIFTAFNIKDKQYPDMSEGDTTEDVVNKLEFGLNGYDNDSEFIAWKTVIESLGECKMFDIADNIKSYMGTYLEMKNLLDNMKHSFLKQFTRANS